MANDIDPDVAADFSGLITAAPAIEIHPDVAADFKTAPTSTPSSADEFPELEEARALSRGAIGGGEYLLHKATGGLADVVLPANADKLRQEFIYQPRSAEGKALTGVGETASNIISYPGRKVTEVTGIPELGTATNMALQFGAARLGLPEEGVPFAYAAARGLPFERPPPDLSPPGSVGAAAARVDLSGATPETQAAHAQAQAAGQTINNEALQRHAEAENLPMPEGETPLRLRKGQATQDPQQWSDEKNLRADPDTHGILVDSETDQNRKLVGSMGEIRRRATPDIVQRNNLEHGQAGIDAIKSQDNADVLNIRAKYKALADANGGAIPIDTGATIGGIDSQLKHGYLTKTAEANPVISSVMDDLRAGKPIDFEAFENARTRLAEVQRGGGSDAVAAGIVRNALEQMPLPKGAQSLKALADDARSAAKARFDKIDANPAYEAAVNDDVPKTANNLHQVGAPSPLADTFMDRYFTGNGPNASRAYIQRLQSVMSNDPIFNQSIEGATLNRLRDSAGIDANGNGGFNYASFRNARAAVDKKADLLLSPESASETQKLSNVAGYIKAEPKGGFTNRSNTALTLQRFGAPVERTPTIGGQIANIGGDIAAAHIGAPAVVAKRLGEGFFRSRADAQAIQQMRDAKLNFALDATAPAAGITSPVRPTR